MDSGGVSPSELDCCEWRLRFSLSGFAFSLLLSWYDRSPVWFTLLFIVVLQFKLLLFDGFELVTEVEFCSFFLEFGKFVLVFGNLFQSRLDEVSSEVIHLDVELVDLVISPSNLKLKIPFLRFTKEQTLVVFLADLLKCFIVGSIQIFGLSASLINNLPPLRGFPFLLFLELFSGLLTEEQPEFLLPLWGHETLLCLLSTLLFEPLSYFRLLGIDVCRFGAGRFVGHDGRLEGCGGSSTEDYYRDTAQGPHSFDTSQG